MSFKLLTDDEVAKIDQTMEATLGNRALAAQMLGLSIGLFQNHLFNTVALRAKWVDSGASPLKPDPDREKTPIKTDAEDDIAVPRLPPAAGVLDDIPTTDVQLATAHDQINQKIAKLGWESMGITGATKALMESFEAFTGGKILRTIDATHGGMMFGFASTAERLDYLKKKLQEPEVLEDPEMEAMYHKQMMECADQMRKFNAEATKAAHVRALIDEKVKAAESKGRTNKKPGWKRAMATRKPVTVGKGGGR